MISLTRGPKLGRACFFPYGAQFPTSEDGERAERLTSTLFGAERWRTPSSGARIGVDEFASHESTLRLRTVFPPLARAEEDCSAKSMRVDTVAGACLIFTGTLLIYVSTLYASAAGGDASEFAFVACDHSIAHPPGYPTFTMLASVGTDLFRGEYFGTRGPAWGANFISAVAGAGCAATLYIAIVTASGDATTDRLTVHASAALGSGLLALQRNVWLNTIQSEVFGLNNLFIALALCCVQYGWTKIPSIVGGMGALVCGLAMTNQHTFVLFGAPLAAWALFCPCRRGPPHPTHIFCLLLLPLVGIVPCSTRLPDT